jgi:hypothetical protein
MGLQGAKDQSGVETLFFSNNLVLPLFMYQELFLQHQTLVLGRLADSLRYRSFFR